MVNYQKMSSVKTVSRYRLKILCISLLLSIGSGCAFVETVEVEPLTEPQKLKGYKTCSFSISGYFPQKYGYVKADTRAEIMLAVTLPDEIFSDPESLGKFVPHSDADNRLVIYLEGKTVASGVVDSVTVKDTNFADVVELQMRDSFGKIGYVQQGDQSLSLRLSDGTGDLFANRAKLASDMDYWNQFATSGQSSVSLSGATHRRRAGISEVFRVDKIAPVCL